MERHVPRGGGNHDMSLKPFGGECFEMRRCQDAKRQSLLRFELFKKIDKFLSLNLRNILISPLEGEKKFLSELCELRNFREGYNLKYSCPVQHETVLEPSPAFVMLTGVRKRLLPLTKREGCDSVISSDFKSKISITNENNLSCKDLSYFGRSALLCRQGRELSALVPQYLSNFPDTVFSRFTSHFSLKRKAAFTLAEVLITLGVIGIVSALTMPAVINHFKAKKLEVQFKTADAMLTKAIKMTVNELGYEDLKDLHLNYYVSSLDNNGGEPRRNLEALNDVWVKQFKGAKQINALPEIYHRGVKTYGIIGNNVWPSDPTTTYNNGYLLPNGMYVGRFNYNMGSSYPTCFYFIFDTNGPYRGPNRYGHDIFKYVSIQYRWGCNPVRGISDRNDGCYWYAHNNVNPAKIQYTYRSDVEYRVWFTTPANASKPDNYWDILFKNESYWRGE